jgi:hypothetical protein
MKIYFIVAFLTLANLSQNTLLGQTLPKILIDTKTVSENYLPDYSYAGYHCGEKALPTNWDQVVLATDFGVIANDSFDDSKALLKAIEEASKKVGNVVLQLPAGRIILSEILYLERSNFVLKGMGSGKNGTEIYCPRPMMYLKPPPALQELREYLVAFDKIQIEKENNINLPFSQYAWSGGFIWTQVPGERVKSYLEKYEVPPLVIAKVVSGARGQKTFVTESSSGLKIGDVVELQLFNKDGEKGEIIDALYQKSNVKPGSHHWSFPLLPIVRQQVEIASIDNNTITIKTPLTIDIKPSYKAQLVQWKHLKEVGIEHMSITFPDSPRVAHHVEPGNNAINLTRLFNSWVKDVVIHNADSGILTEEIANVTIKDIVTKGNNIAHYTVTFGGVHNVLAENVKVYNEAVHSLSFNTLSTKNVYKNCEVFKIPVLDQHSGANHQNLFDNVTVHFTLDRQDSFPLFGGGGAPYWRPSHGAFSTFWNIKAIAENTKTNEPIVLNGVDDGPLIRIVGLHGNKKITLKYGPDPYIEQLNSPLKLVPSLYDYQLKRRLLK